MTLWDKVKIVWRFIMQMDLILLILVLSLMGFGIFVIHHIGIQAGGSLQTYAFKQIIWLAVGFCIMLIIAYIDYDWFGNNAWIFYFIGLFLLGLVLIPGIGKEINSSQSWIQLPGFTIQPSEIAKPFTLIALAWYATRPRVLLAELTNLIPVVLLAAVPIILIGLQPDIGSALVFIPLTAAVLFFAGSKVRYLTYPLLMAAILMPLMYLILKPHQKKRIDVFLHPVVQPVTVKYATKLAHKHQLSEEIISKIDKMSNPWFYINNELDLHFGTISAEKYETNRQNYLTLKRFIADDGWQAYQSALAVGSGGKMGKGWGNGTQIKLGFLPKSITTTDCIFSIICEEGGFFWAVVVLLMLLAIILCAVRTACIARDLFGKVLALSIALLFLCHTYINVGMAIGISPIIGIPLPFLSYGGSFVISTMVSVGLLQSIYMRRGSPIADETSKTFSSVN